VQLAGAFYLFHLMCQGWIASSEIFLGAAVLCAAWAVWKGHLEPAFHPIYFPLVLFLIASVTSSLLAPRPGYSLLHVSELHTFLTFPLAIVLYHSYPHLTRKAITALALLGIYEACYGMLQYFVLSPHDIEHRITGTASHVMTFSGIILPLSLLFLLLAIDEKRLLFAAASLLTTLALVLTLTRGAWLGFAAGLVAVVLYRRARVIIYLLPVALVVVTLSPMSIFSRLVSTFDLQQSSNFDRIRMLQAGVEIIRDHPFFGIGPGNIKETYPLYREADAPRFRIPHLHNNFVEIWVERGVLAATAYVLLIGFFLREALARGAPDTPRRSWSTIALAVAVSLTSAGLFEYNFGDSEILLHLLDLMSLVIGSRILIAAAGVSDARQAPASAM
jgi:O-antigen ligase